MFNVRKLEQLLESSAENRRTLATTIAAARDRTDEKQQAASEAVEREARAADTVTTRDEAS